MIDLPKNVKADAIASIERYFADNFDQRVGNIAAGGLLSFFLEEIGPSVYNQAVADVQRSLMPRINELEARVQEVDIEVHKEEFQYWQKYDAAKSANAKPKSRK